MAQTVSHQGAGQGALLIGAGGLGSSAAWALAAAGVSRLGVVDDDRVSLSNLHRQVIYTVEDVGCLKVEALARRLADQGFSGVVELYRQRLESPEEMANLARGYGVVVDGSDNFSTRFAANDAALASGRPLVHGAAIGLRGQVMTIQPGISACLRCLFHGPPDGDERSCSDDGVLGPIVAEVGGWMALEAMKLLRDVGVPLLNRILTIDMGRSHRRLVSVPRQAGCPGCGKLKAI
ncbi:MAG: HesA/MoeB/ThiF family protein [Magnetococcales bacterium]|nr:HesA/MoeB/ThiF family protein [Magnetococcales bacterium]